MDLHALRGNDRRIKPWAVYNTPCMFAEWREGGRFDIAWRDPAWRRDRAWCQFLDCLIGTQPSQSCPSLEELDVTQRSTRFR